jgi:hypothetical protein
MSIAHLLSVRPAMSSPVYSMPASSYVPCGLLPVERSTNARWLMNCAGGVPLGPAA